MAASKDVVPSRKSCIWGDVLYRVIPVAGGASSLAFSLNVMNPRLFADMFAQQDLLVANGLWFNAHLGVGLHLYGRKHMRQAGARNRVFYSVFGAVVFNFGTVLLLATVKSLLPKNNLLRSLVGLASGVALLFTGKEYLDFVDSRTGDVLGH